MCAYVFLPGLVLVLVLVLVLGLVLLVFMLVLLVFVLVCVPNNIFVCAVLCCSLSLYSFCFLYFSHDRV